MTGKMTPKRWLAGLGNSPDAVARTLKRRGCRGARGSFTLCPVAVGLERRFRVDVLVRPDVICFSTGPSVRTSTAVWTFIRRFDRGDYPELEIA